MQIRGIVRTAVLEEDPPGSGTIELVLSVQGVGAGQPRKLVIPYELLLADETLDPDLIAGRGFEAEIELQGTRWLVSRIAFAAKLLRPSD